MDVIDILKRKTIRQEVPNHPLGTLAVEVRYTYGFGLAVLAMGNIKVIDELREPFWELCLSLKLSDEMIQNYMSDINNHFDRKMDEFLTLLERGIRYKYCFYVDMLSLVYAADWGKQYAIGVYHQFEMLLHLSDYEMNFLKRFLTTKQDEDGTHAKSLYQDFIDGGNHIDYMILKYMNPEFQLKEQLYSLHLESGGVYIIDKETIIDGDIFVTNGTKLVVNNAKISMTGSIIIEDGRVEMIDSELVAIAQSPDRLAERESLVVANKIHRFRAERTIFNGNYITSGIQQKEGELSLTDCKILACKDKRGIDFKGEHIIIEDCQFRECFDGGLNLEGEMKAFVHNTLFIKCEGEHGGGIHCDNCGSTNLSGCTFIDCSARFLGAAIYFPYKKYGQVVEGVEIMDPMPLDNAVFNAYEYIR